MIDNAKALRKHNLESGVYRRAAEAAAARARRPRWTTAAARRDAGVPALPPVPFNTVPGVRIFHVDDKSAVTVPSIKEHCVGDDRPAFSVGAARFESLSTPVRPCLLLQIATTT